MDTNECIRSETGCMYRSQEKGALVKLLWFRVHSSMSDGVIVTASFIGVERRASQSRDDTGYGEKIAPRM